jgi:hypothetical protein
MALRSDVVEAAGVRSSERRRAWADSSKRANEPDAEPPPRVVDALLATGSGLADPATPTGCVAVRPEEPGLTLRPPFFGDVTFFLHHPGWKPLQGSAATMSQAGLQARAGSPDPLRGTRHVSVGFSPPRPSQAPPSERQ